MVLASQQLKWSCHFKPSQKTLALCSSALNLCRQPCLRRKNRPITCPESEWCHRQHTFCNFVTRHELICGSVQERGRGRWGRLVYSTAHWFWTGSPVERPGVRWRNAEAFSFKTSYAQTTTTATLNNAITQTKGPQANILRIGVPRLERLTTTVAHEPHVWELFFLCAESMSAPLEILYQVSIALFLSRRVTHHAISTLRRPVNFVQVYWNSYRLV